MKTKLVIFGITGDLAKRKLLPALTAVLATGQFDDLEVIGVSRRQVSIQEIDGAADLVERVTIISMDLAKEEEYIRLKNELSVASDEQLLVYFAVPPSASYQIIELMGKSGFGELNIKLLLEKPFGVDFVSAENMAIRLNQYFNESQLYRIDHYLAKEMTQNIVAFRGGNAIFSHLWNSEAIEKIEIVATETLGVEGRGVFYEQTGALRDVVQGHLMQLLALVIMELPHSFDWNELPNLRHEALRKIRPADPVLAHRAQYEGYQQEVANLGSMTETFVSLELVSEDSRWKGVPLRLTTGKSLDRKTTEIRVDFKKYHDAQRNSLIFRIQPDEGVEIDLSIKKPGYEQKFEVQKLKFTYPEDAQLPEAYEQVIVDAIRSRKSLFASSEEVLESWRVLQPLLDAWSMDETALIQYAKGKSTHTICSVE